MGCWFQSLTYYTCIYIYIYIHTYGDGRLATLVHVVCSALNVGPVSPQDYATIVPEPEASEKFLGVTLGVPLRLS